MSTAPERLAAAGGDPADHPVDLAEHLERVAQAIARGKAAPNLTIDDTREEEQ